MIPPTASTACFIKPRILDKQKKTHLLLLIPLSVLYATTSNPCPCAPFPTSHASLATSILFPTRVTLDPKLLELDIWSMTTSGLFVKSSAFRLRGSSENEDCTRLSGRIWRGELLIERDIRLRSSFGLGTIVNNFLYPYRMVCSGQKVALLLYRQVGVKPYPKKLTSR